MKVASLIAQRCGPALRDPAKSAYNIRSHCQSSVTQGRKGQRFLSALYSGEPRQRSRTRIIDGQQQPLRLFCCSRPSGLHSALGPIRDLSAGAAALDRHLSRADGTTCRSGRNVRNQRCAKTCDRIRKRPLVNVHGCPVSNEAIGSSVRFFRQPLPMTITLCYRELSGAWGCRIDCTPVTDGQRYSDSSSKTRFNSSAPKHRR